MSISRHVYVGPCAVGVPGSKKVWPMDLEYELSGLCLVQGDNAPQHTWIVNVSGGAPRDFRPLPMEGANIPLAHTAITREMAWFTETYAADLATLRREYETVTIEWRILAWHEVLS